MVNNRGRAARAAKNRQAAERKKAQLHELNKYEGGQFSGGRKKTPNLKKMGDGQLMNMHGVVFSQDDKKRLESLVNRANRKRKKQLEWIAEQPRMVAGKPTGQTKGDVAALAKWNSDNDVIITRKTKSLQRFESREQFENYLKYLERVNNPDYIPAKMAIYRENLCSAIDKQSNGRGDDVIAKIRSLDEKEFMKDIVTHDEMQIGHWYGPDQSVEMLNDLRDVLGLEEIDPAYDEGYEDEEY